jgi:hypothetical protein
MTLCVAAKGIYEDKEAIVMASDWRIEDGVSGSETAHKQGTFTDGWHFMYAGTQGRAVELVISIREHLETNPLKPPHKISKTLKDAVRKHREKLVDEYIHSQIARSYEWLLDIGSEKLPSDYYSQLINYVSSVRFDAQLILCGFYEGSAGIFLIDETRGEPIVRPIENFAAIGSGSIVAESVLHSRANRLGMPLKMTLYQVYEAKRLGESAPGVGARTTFTILLADGRIGTITDSGGAFLQGCYGRYAPQLIEDSNDWEEIPESFIEFPVNQLGH